MHHTPARRPSQLSSHLSPTARSVIRAGRPDHVRVLLTLKRTADVDSIKRIASELECDVHEYIEPVRVLALVANAEVLDVLARADGVLRLEVERIRRR